MPKVVVYVPVSDWRRLMGLGLDPAPHVRELVRAGLAGETAPVRIATAPPVVEREVRTDFKRPVRPSDAT